MKINKRKRTRRTNSYQIRSIEIIESPKTHSIIIKTTRKNRTHEIDPISH